ncbi:MAG TPA: hypothetical protein VGK20_00075 [Candidatus Binatia bacterium]
MRRLPHFLFYLVSSIAVSVSCVPAFAANGDCGQPQTVGSAPTAADALFVLETSVGTKTCTLCVCDVNNSGTVTASDALLVLQSAVDLPVSLNCPTGCVDGDAQCPGVAQFALFAKVRPGPCTTNADCQPFSSCDTSLHRCTTVTDLDTGWTGLAQNQDIDDPIPARLFVDCHGPAPCGECTITGHDPSLGDCRCADDNRKICFKVAEVDNDVCGGQECICNFGPPSPQSAGNIPVCVLNQLSAQPSGHGNVDTGDGLIELPLNEKVFLGSSLFAPCPVCINDPTPADGVRGGVCVGGHNDGQSCDAQAFNSSFPPPTGALYSLDCFPDSNADISNGGLNIKIPLDTGNQQMAFDLPCGVDSSQNCPCRVCSANSTIPCHSDSDCTAASAGTCSSDGAGEATAPNACSDGVCQAIASDAGNNEGQCATGPNDSYCDAVVRADGGGLIGCNANIDCAASSIGIDAGACSLSQRRPCFLDPIVAQGAANPVVPIASGPFCIPPSTSASVNASAGLPGPGRLVVQTVLTLFCKSDPQAAYTPGTGGCPP